jgi:hypothetical protein
MVDLVPRSSEQGTKEYVEIANKQNKQTFSKHFARLNTQYSAASSVAARCFRATIVFSVDARRFTHSKSWWWMVDDGRWTMERMGALCAGFYQVRSKSPPLTSLSTPRIIKTIE